MIKVTPKHRENLPSLMRRFKKLCEREGILKDIRRCEAYEKPSEKRRRKQKSRKQEDRPANKKPPKKEKRTNSPSE